MAAVEYDFREPRGWSVGVAKLEQKRLDDGAVVILFGDCPRCDHYMDVALPIKKSTGALITTQRDAETLGDGKSFTKTARCNCQMAHKGRPDEITEGCGAFGQLDIG